MNAAIQPRRFLRAADPFLLGTTRQYSGGVSAPSFSLPMLSLYLSPVRPLPSSIHFSPVDIGSSAAAVRCSRQKTPIKLSRQSAVPGEQWDTCRSRSAFNRLVKITSRSSSFRCKLIRVLAERLRHSQLYSHRHAGISTPQYSL